MYIQKNHISDYLKFCQNQKQLNPKTIKAYRIDLKQFYNWIATNSFSELNASNIESYISHLHNTYKPKTVKRKIASIKAFFRFLEKKEYIHENPMYKIQTRFREPKTLPKTIPLNTIETLLSTMYRHKNTTKTTYQKKCITRDIAVIELLFATGMRISELCSLRPSDVNLQAKAILIYGKGAKERKIHIGNNAVISILNEYEQNFKVDIDKCGYFFVNRLKKRLSEQSVREMINKYASLAATDMHITPHMFRHSFATYLLECDVDIRYIQEMLGHSSINITEIYTHVAMAKQKNILETKHPRKNFRI